jgi:hypothetical protein
MTCPSCPTSEHGQRCQAILEAAQRDEGNVMKRTWFLLPLALSAMSVAATPQNQRTVQTSAVRIVRPRAGQALTNSFATLRFELARPKPAGGENNFVIQLDAREPVNTSENEYAFTGMRPGRHEISVTEVDANGTPLPDARTEVQFTVNAPEDTAASAPAKKLKE